MTESFDGAMAFARAIMSDCDAPILDRLQKAHEAEIAELQGQYERKAIDLQKAHEREIVENLCDACDQCDRMDKKAHEHEMEQLRRLRFREGYEAGQRSMDAEHYQLKLRLQGLRFGDGSHENLSRLAYAIYPCPTGWGKESCEGLRDKIIEMLGGVHDEPAPIPASRCACDANCTGRGGEPQTVAYDVLGNERRKAVCELRKIDTDAGGFVKSLASAVGVEWQAPRVVQTIAEVRDRLIYLLGGDEKYFYLSVREDGSIDSLKSVEEADALIEEVRRRADQSSPTSLENETGITDELREWTKEFWGTDSDDTYISYANTLLAIANRIDEQFNHAMVSRSAELGCYKLHINQLEQERDKLRKKLDTIQEALDG